MLRYSAGERINFFHDRIGHLFGGFFSGLLPYAQRIKADAPLILCNGARIQDPAGGAITVWVVVHIAARALRHL